MTEQPGQNQRAEPSRPASAQERQASETHPVSPVRSETTEEMFRRFDTVVYRKNRGSGLEL